MSKVKVLFFAADPLSAPPDGRIPRLLLDEDVRQILTKVRAAEHRDALEFDVRWAARTDDLLQALNEARPQVVHFSGHGGNDGLVLVDPDGGPHWVDGAALAQLFQLFRDDIRVAVLNACFSLPQAQAIAAAVGCAIGTRGEISDEAAITFGASFYRAIAFGRSVQAAYDQARAALALEYFEDAECPRLVARPGVDPDRIFLVQPVGVEGGKQGVGRVGTAIAALALAAAVVVASMSLGDRTAHPPGQLLADTVSAPASREVADTSPPRDSAPAAASAGKHAAVRSRDEARQPSVDSQPRERSVEAQQGAVIASPVQKLPGPPDTFAVLSDRPRDSTLPPAYPR
ncbi:MAG TPA: CHAT domain-containing protein [Longimicrobium sp.]|nr:CHAT domain-containing protein [Longimicrobium sp.]